MNEGDLLVQCHASEQIVDAGLDRLVVVPIEGAVFRASRPGAKGKNREHGQGPK